MRWARVSFAGFVVLVGLVVLGLGALYVAQPASYRIARSRTIAAPPALVMAQLADLHAFAAWDPWPAEPGTVPSVTFSTLRTGVGAWIDRRDAHGGSRTTITALTSDHIEMSNATAGSLGGAESMQSFELRATAGGTEVTWALSADLHGLGRLLWPFVHLEQHVAPDMDAALSRLDRASH